MKKRVKKMKKGFGFLLPLLVVILISVFLARQNYEKGLFLSGWDNLHPEFNLKLNIGRSLSSAWQEYQGLGLLGGMAHAADLPRQLVLWVFSLILPLHLVRYFWIFLMLILGPLGTYFLVVDQLGRFKQKQTPSEESIRTLRRCLASSGENLAGFVAAIFYLFNLATLQTFFVPFETFVGFFGFLPWLLFFALEYLYDGKKKKLLFYFLVSLFATSAFYVQTMFVVFSIFLFVFALEAIVRQRISGLSGSIKLAIVTLAVNAFWLLPVAYFSFTNSNVTVTSKINSIATPETQLMNEARGGFNDVTLLKGYWFDYYALGKDGKFDYLYKDWIHYQNNFPFRQASQVIFYAGLLGLVLVIFKKKVHFRFSFPLLFFISYLMLATVNPPLGGVYKFLVVKIPLFSEIFRNAFTKWSVAFAFILSLGLGSLISILGDFLKGKLRFLLILPVLVFAGLVFLTVRPVFEGRLISEKMKVDIPDEYFQFFEWSKSMPTEKRIAFLPYFNFWGWNFHDWGYEGSGFLWYGTKQPILDRAFNVWSPYNETFYNEISNVLYQYQLVDKDKLCEDEKCDWDEVEKAVLSSNEKVVSEFDNILKKYQVSYLLLDESIINAGGSNDILFIPQIKDLVAHSKIINQTARFGFLTVYDVTGVTSVRKWVWAPEDYVDVAVNNTYSQFDSIYSRFGNYITSNSSETSYPFVNFDPRSDVDISVIQVASSSGEMVDNLLVENRRMKAKVILPIKDRVFEGFRPDQGFKEGNNCDLKKKGSAIKKRLEKGKGNYYKAEDGGVSCDYFYYPQIKNRKSYVLRIKGKNLAGRGLKIYLQNLNSKRMDLETLLPNGEFDEYFLLLPDFVNDDVLDSLDRGYTLNVETRSFGRISSENIINKVEFFPVDDIPQTLQGLTLLSNNLKIIDVKKYGTGLYKVDVEGDGLLELGQGYEKGWIALSMSNGQWLMSNKLQHVKVNGWANGWFINDRRSMVNGQKSTIYLFFWPQLLEWGGMVIGLGAFIYLLLMKK